MTHLALKLTVFVLSGVMPITQVWFMFLLIYLLSDYLDNFVLVVVVQSNFIASYDYRYGKKVEGWVA